MSDGRALRFKKSVLVILALILVSPVFLVLSDLVGYHEPLDVAAEALGLPDLTESINWTPFLDYNVPGLPATVGYVIAGILGISIVLGLGLLLRELVSWR